VSTIRFARAYLKAGISAEGRVKSTTRESKLRESKNTTKRVEEYDESVEENSQSTNTRVRESTVRGFELDSGAIPTVKSEANKESEN
jgi:hypothetical protein